MLKYKDKKKLFLWWENDEDDEEEEEEELKEGLLCCSVSLSLLSHGFIMFSVVLFLVLIH